MDKIKYLEEKIEFYRQEVERYKSMILYEKEDAMRKEFLEAELEAAEEMFEMFVTINTQVLAWDSIKNSVQFTEDGAAKIDVIIKRDSDERDKFNTLFEAFEFDPDFEYEKSSFKFSI